MHHTLTRSLIRGLRSSSATHRAWQELPRHLRRRAASHDVRRVPQRLRGKSAREVPHASIVTAQTTDLSRFLD